ncbi:hypothetical protein F1880_006692 [Penicillium rolfsii]|nr:hypothetical protein F1880_006692 [Penicillium rolfsii]
MKESIHNWDTHVPEILEPLMAQDMKLLQSLLGGPSFRACSEIPYGYNYWPEGLQLLLQSGKAPSREALLHACYVNIPKSLGYLLSARSFYIESQHMEAASSRQNTESMSLMVDAFVEERRELQSLAEHHLTSEELASLDLRPCSPLDFQARKAYQLLQASGLVLPDWRNDNEGYLAYASIRDNCDMADLLWHRGYRDVDEMDSRGCTSLVFAQKLEFANWLISHGADIHRRVQGMPALHLMVDNIHLNTWPMSKADEEVFRAIFQLVLQDNVRDHCDCPCSSAGCSAMTRFLSNVLLTQHYWTGPGDIFDTVHLVWQLIYILEEGPAPEVASEIIRFLTFESLQIPHTCRHPMQCLSSYDGKCDYPLHYEPCYHWAPKDLEDIEEMQDEWRELIALHEELVARFQDMYHTLDLPLYEFLDTIWAEEVLKRSEFHGSPSQREISRMRELGVILDEVEEDSSEGEVDVEELQSEEDASESDANSSSVIWEYS